MKALPSPLHRHLNCPYLRMHGRQVLSSWIVVHPCMLLTGYAGLWYQLLVPEMIPIVGSKINVNTQTKILELNIKNLQVRKLNHRNDNKCKYKWFILVRFLWPTSSPQATRFRFSFILWLCTPKINILYTTWQIYFAKCIQLFLQIKKTTTPCISSTRRRSCTMLLFEWLQIIL